MTQAANQLLWSTPFAEVLNWSGSHSPGGFVGDTINVTYNCLNRHVAEVHKNRGHYLAGRTSPVIVAG
ncbi:hypothetical protein DIJ64_12560 [Mycobacterium leprae]|uniref:Acetyl-coenzyme A synthetase N-terminal domain-containing protein n=1 Tax=Mycobacterium leprae TaxID=1769 RepID=A0AAD0KS19_MYCLR|nr:hypothetical protein DIJ64_12560 [Mycobacterium leprae]